MISNPTHASPHILGILLLLGLITSIQAQTAVQPELPTPEPTRVLMDPNGTYVAQRWSLFHGVPIYSAPKADSMVLGRLEYLEDVCLADGYPEAFVSQTKDRYRLNRDERANNTDWALVCVPQDSQSTNIKSIRGWVPRRYLTDRLEAERDRTTQILKKAVPVTKPVEENATEKQRSMDRRGKVQSLLAPSELTDIRPDGLPPLRTPELDLYRLCFVYAEYGDWLLISPDPSQSILASRENLRSNVFGWVPQERVARWNTRECFQWNRRTFTSRISDPGKLFLSPADAIRYKQGMPIAQQSFGEPDPRKRNGEIGELALDAMRFHLLLNPRQAQQNGIDANAQWTYDSTSSSGQAFVNNLFEIGAVLSNGRINSEVERQQGQLESLAGELSDTELLFIIDDTHSMRFAFTVLANVVDKISQTFKEKPGDGDIRIGLCYYHDGDSAEAAVTTTTTRLASIKEGAGLQLRIGELTNRSKNWTPGESGGDRLERMFDGIYHGVQAARFQTHSRKLVVLIGDCGEKGPLRGGSRYSLKDLAEQLVPEVGRPIEFHAIQVKNPKLNEDVASFETQINVDLRKVYEERMRKVYDDAFAGSNDLPDVEKFFSYAFCSTPNLIELNDDDIAAVQKVVEQQVLPNIVAARDQGERLRNTMRSYINTGSLDDADEIAEFAIADKFVLQKTLKDENLEEYGANPQLYHRTYAWEKNRQGQVQLSRMVFVDEYNLDRAIKALRDIEDQYKAGREIDESNVINILAQQVGSNDDIPPEIVSPRDKADWLIKTLSFRSPLFIKLLDPELQGRPLPDEYDEVFLKRRLLEAVKAGRQTHRRDYALVARGSGVRMFNEWQLESKRGIGEGNLTEFPALERGFPRFYKSKSSNPDSEKKYYYLDYEEEWP